MMDPGSSKKVNGRDSKASGGSSSRGKRQMMAKRDSTSIAPMDKTIEEMQNVKKISAQDIPLSPTRSPTNRKESIINARKDSSLVDSRRNSEKSLRKTQRGGSRTSNRSSGGSNYLSERGKDLEVPKSISKQLLETL